MLSTRTVNTVGVSVEARCVLSFSFASSWVGFGGADVCLYVAASCARVE